MSLDGLRAWIADVERKLGMRTRVFLALATIAIGISGAAAYLAIDARDNAVSESDVQQLQQDLEAQIASGAGGTAGTELAQLEAELKALQAELDRLGGKDSKGASAEGGNSSSSGDGSVNTTPGATTNPGSVQELLEQTKRENEKAEAAE